MLQNVIYQTLIHIFESAKKARTSWSHLLLQSDLMSNNFLEYRTVLPMLLFARRNAFYALFATNEVNIYSIVWWVMCFPCLSHGVAVTWNCLLGLQKPINSYYCISGKIYMRTLVDFDSLADITWLFACCKGGNINFHIWVWLDDCIC